MADNNIMCDSVSKNVDEVSPPVGVVTLRKMATPLVSNSVASMTWMR